MPIDFPNSPSNGTQHTVGGITWQYDGSVWNVVTGGASFRVSATAPSAPVVGDLWYDTESGEMFIYYDSAWVSPSVVATVAASVEVAASAPSAPTTGDLWFDSNTGDLTIYYDSQWVTPNVAASLATAAAATITGTNAEGSSSSFARADHNHALDASLVVPTGAIMPYGGTSAPTSWLLCDGSEKAVATYPNLDSVLGTTYGTRTNGSGGAGSSHFRLPDLRGRVPMGAGTGARDGESGTGAISGGTSLTARTAGAWMGGENHTLTTAQMPSHSHTYTDPGHTHGTNSPANFAGSGAFQGTQQVIKGDTLSAATGITIHNTGGDGSHNNTQPSLVLNYIIKT